MGTQESTQTESVNQALAAVSEMNGKYLTFWTDRQLFGIPIRDVGQIVGMQEITELPYFPTYVKGIINLRGSIIPLIDVRLRFGKPEMNYTERTCVIVTSICKKEIGFIVDAVNEVAAISEEQIAPPPKVSDDCPNNTYLTGVAKQEGKIVLLVDAAKILSAEIMDSLSENGGKEYV